MNPVGGGTQRRRAVWHAPQAPMRCPTGVVWSARWHFLARSGTLCSHMVDLWQTMVHRQGLVPASNWEAHERGPRA